MLEHQHFVVLRLHFDAELVELEQLEDVGCLGLARGQQVFKERSWLIWLLRLRFHLIGWLVFALKELLKVLDRFEHLLEVILLLSHLRLELFKLVLQLALQNTNDLFLIKLLILHENLARSLHQIKLTRRLRPRLLPH